MATFGQIGSDLTIGANNAVRRNSGDSAYEQFTPLGYTLTATTAGFNPADATTYYFAHPGATSTSTPTTLRMYIPKSGTIKAVYGHLSVAGTLGSTETSTMWVRLNNTTDTTISTSVQNSANSNPFSNSGLSVSVSAGDYITFKWTTPTWATNPTTVACYITAYIE